MTEKICKHIGCCFPAPVEHMPLGERRTFRTTPSRSCQSFDTKLAHVSSPST